MAVIHNESVPNGGLEFSKEHIEAVFVVILVSVDLKIMIWQHRRYSLKKVRHF